jgi:hypothetical protein
MCTRGRCTHKLYICGPSLLACGDLVSGRHVNIVKTEEIGSYTRLY